MRIKLFKWVLFIQNPYIKVDGKKIKVRPTFIFMDANPVTATAKLLSRQATHKNAMKVFDRDQGAAAKIRETAKNNFAKKVKQ